MFVSLKSQNTLIVIGSELLKDVKERQINQTAKL